jgi:hypothetical protein
LYRTHPSVVRAVASRVVDGERGKGLINRARQSSGHWSSFRAPW